MLSASKKRFSNEYVNVNIKNFRKCDKNAVKSFIVYIAKYMPVKDICAHMYVCCLPQNATFTNLSIYMTINDTIYT